VCEIAAGTNELPQHFVYEGESAVAFLDAYPRAYGYTLVAPREHREQVAAERMYLYTFGSNQGGAHVHWHVVPLPPGVPYERQQGAWAGWDGSVLTIPQEEMASLAARISAKLG
ncbi:MAG TPA: HIT family protein, partial [Rubrobacteraceae bacterium]|nr:HIT family protein [Rubrobacteraceae bacterium]